MKYIRLVIAKRLMPIKIRVLDHEEVKVMSKEQNTVNANCVECVEDCKQTARVELVACPKYEPKCRVVVAIAEAFVPGKYRAK